MKKIFALILASAMMLSLAACGSKEEPQQEEKKVLTVGTSADYPPFEFYTESDEGRTIVGADVKLAQYIADELGMELELIDMGFDGLLGNLEADKFDLVISGMSIKPGRKCVYSDPYFSAAQALLVPAGQENSFSSLDELKGKKIGGQMGSLQEELATQYAGESAQIVANVQDMIMLVSEGKLDGMFCEGVVADSAAAKSDKVAVANLDIPTEENLVAVCAKEGNTELIEKVNTVVAKVVDQNLYGTWMTEFLDMEDAGKPEA